MNSACDWKDGGNSGTLKHHTVPYDIAVLHTLWGRSNDSPSCTLSFFCSIEKCAMSQFTVTRSQVTSPLYEHGKGINTMKCDYDYDYDCDNHHNHIRKHFFGIALDIKELCYIVWLYTTKTMTMTIVNPQQIAFIQIVGEPRACLRMLPASALSVPGTLSHQLWWAEQTSEWLYPPDKCSPEWLELPSNSKLNMSQETCGTLIFVWPAHTTNTDSDTWFWYILFLMMYYDIRSCHDPQLPLASSTMKVLGLRARSLLKALKTG